MLNASTVNMELRKTNLGMCNVCKKIKPRNELKYINRFPSFYCIPACEQCRARYSKKNYCLILLKKCDSPNKVNHHTQ